MLSTCLFANENIASTIASNILAGELNPVLRVVRYVLSNKFRRICHLRYRVQDNLICLPSAALRATNIAYNKFYPVTSFCNIVRNKFYRVYLPQHWGQRIISYGFLLPHSTANYIGSPVVMQVYTGHNQSGASIWCTWYVTQCVTCHTILWKWRENHTTRSVTHSEFFYFESHNWKEKKPELQLGRVLKPCWSAPCFLFHWYRKWQNRVFARALEEGVMRWGWGHRR